MLRSFLLIVFIFLFCNPQISRASDADTLHFLTNSNQDTTRFFACLKLSAKYHKVDNDSADFYLKKAANELSVITDSYPIEIQEKCTAAYYKQKAFVFQYTDEYDSAESLYNKALYVYNKYQILPQKAEIYNNIGALYEQRGNSPKALHYYLKLMKLCDSANLLKMKSKALVNIGVVYANEGRYEDALEHYKQAAKLKYEVGDRKGEALIYNNIGIVYYYLEDYDKVLENFKRGLNVYRELNDLEAQSRPFFNIAEVYYLQDRLKEALYYYKKSYEIDKKLGKRVSQAETLSTIGTVYANLGQMEDAIRVINEAIRILKQTEALSTLSDAIYKLSLFYEYSGDYKLALKYYQKHTRISDSLKSMKKAEQLSHLKLQYETEQKDQEIELLKRNNELMSKARDQEISAKWLKVLAILFGIISIVLFTISVMMLVRLRKERRIRYNSQPTGHLMPDAERSGGFVHERSGKKHHKDRIDFLFTGYNLMSRFINMLSLKSDQNLRQGKDYDLFSQYAVNQLVKGVEALTVFRHIQSGAVRFEKEGISISELQTKLAAHFSLYPFIASPIKIQYDNQENDELIQSDPHRLFYILISIVDYLVYNKLWDETSNIKLVFTKESSLEFVFSDLNRKFNFDGTFTAMDYDLRVDFRLYTAIRLIQFWGGDILNVSDDSCKSFKILLPSAKTDSMTYSYQIDGIQSLNINCKVKIILDQTEIHDVALFENLAKKYGKSLRLEIVKGYPKELIKNEEDDLSIIVTGVSGLSNLFNQFLREFKLNSDRHIGLLLIHSPNIEMDRIANGENIASIPENKLEERLLFEFERLVHFLCLK
jgi:tetratricopeptide (TPR) repeat protein